MLNAPFTRDKQGQPQAHQPGMFGKLKAAVGMGQPNVEEHRLDKGQYSVIVDVGKSVETRRQETMIGMSSLAQAAPELVPRFADLWVKSMDIPEADAIADRIKPPGVDDPNSLPPAAQAQIAQLTQVIQELQQAADDNLTKKAIAAQSDAVKVQVASQSDQTKKDIAGIQAQSSVAVAEIKAGMDDMANQIKLLVAMMGVEHEARMAEKQGNQAEKTELHRAGHEVGHTLMQHEHAKELQDRQHEQALEQAEVGHQQALEQGAQPPPIDPNAKVSE
jgi:hypothetical protein